MRPGSSGVESGWMFGRLHGAEGCFPEAYVQIMEGFEPVVAELSNERLEDDQPMRFGNFQNFDFLSNKKILMFPILFCLEMFLSSYSFISRKS